MAADSSGRPPQTSAGGDTLNQLQAEWDELADLDALWAILSYRRKKFSRWGHEEFFAEGERQVDRLLEPARDLGLPEGRGAVLDFGCGVGRLAPPLSRDFDDYWGVDISQEMVARARRLQASLRNCHFAVCADASLDRFPDRSFDQIVSVCVLQHIPAQETITSYLRSFCRLLRPGGLLVFQLPAHISAVERFVHNARRGLYHRLGRLGVPDRLRFRRLGLFPMTMNGVSQAEVERILRTSGAEVLDVRSKRGGLAISDRTYYATKVT
ncbi:MAG: methyltransferase domain-containing protein [Actinomycetota bacterium]|nr:methyltransferase domain-containing protein [Actinomycetota bacterium]